ncbi:hypothetical protein ACT3TZ_13860 [Brachybacterium sp. AOP25-B2-12]|uniref:hypothetical protein n=1 Tax=Brachybacterium sp. AOP25-B2-12 TaxID=3457710 RepID=UPI004034237D
MSASDRGKSTISAAMYPDITGINSALGTFSKTAAALDTSALLRNALKGLDLVSLTRPALAGVDLTSITQGMLQLPKVTSGLTVDPQFFGAAGWSQEFAQSMRAIDTFSPSAALADALKSLDFGAQMRTMQFGAATKLLESLHGLQLTTSELVDVDEEESPLDEDFDLAVRAVISDAAEQLDTTVHLPEGTIAYSPWGDVDLQPDPEYREFAAQAAFEIVQARQPADAIRRAVINTSFALLILVMAQQQVAGILEDAPDAISQPIEEHWPDWAHLPGWLTDIIVLGYALRGANRDRRRALDES